MGKTTYKLEGGSRNLKGASSIRLVSTTVVLTKSLGVAWHRNFFRVSGVGINGGLGCIHHIWHHKVQNVRDPNTVLGIWHIIVYQSIVDTFSRCSSNSAQTNGSIFCRKHSLDPSAPLFARMSDNCLIPSSSVIIDEVLNSARDLFSNSEASVHFSRIFLQVGDKVLTDFFGI
uniref:Uncharacterized protein n=1 Tax=Heterorhabditis bacteriophora TaxID=37862 RepID=A0A1I7WAX0_HETBA